ncbi:MAG TPA: ferritin [Bacteroidota bacterium]|nr:ferritin [Bacteroidota bacterium]
MLSKSMQDALNEQIKNEIQSAYIYLAMAQHCESVNLPGFAHWLTQQWNEEMSHAMKFVDYVNDRGGRVLLGAIEKPQAEYASPLAVFKQVLAHEQKVTGMINKLYALALKENDYASQVELQWFIKEQVEEEKNAGDIIEQLKMIGDSGTPLIMLDRQLGSRGK